MVIAFRKPDVLQRGGGTLAPTLVLLQLRRHSRLGTLINTATTLGLLRVGKCRSQALVRQSDAARGVEGRLCAPTCPSPPA